MLSYGGKAIINLDMVLVLVYENMRESRSNFKYAFKGLYNVVN